MQFDTRSLWIFIHFPQLQLDLLERSNDTASETAVININSNQICQLNQQAKQAGVKKGMGLASASLMHPQLCLKEYDANIEEQYLTQLANQLYIITSDIVIHAPQSIVLRVQNMLHLYGGLDQYWRVIQQCLNKNRLNYNYASAYSFQAAKLLALNKVKLITDDESTLAKVLNSCSLQYSGIDNKDLAKLERVGIRHYVDLLNIPTADLANRISKFSMSLVNQLLGKQGARVSFYHPPEQYKNALELLYDIANSDKLLPVIEKMLDDLSSYLYLRNARTLSIKVHYKQREHPELIHTYNSIRPIYQSGDWLDIISLKLESTKFSSHVYALALYCDKYEVVCSNNEDMFTNKQSHIAGLNLLARLQSKLGEQALSQPYFCNDFRPEQANAQLNINALSQSPIENTFKYDRPGFLLKEPCMLDTKVKIIKGPERIYTGWWDDNKVCRDYYIAQSEDGQQLWVYKTYQKQWFIHGYFI